MNYLNTLSVEPNKARVYIKDERMCCIKPEFLESEAEKSPKCGVNGRTNASYTSLGKSVTAYS